MSQNDSFVCLRKRQIPRTYFVKEELFFLRVSILEGVGSWWRHDRDDVLRKLGRGDDDLFPARFLFIC